MFGVGLMCSSGNSAWTEMITAQHSCTLGKNKLYLRFSLLSLRSKAVLLLWIFYVFFVLCLLCICGRLFTCALLSPAGKGLTSWLSVVVSNCEFFTFPSVSWVRCGTWLYRFLIFAPLLTLTKNIWVWFCVILCILETHQYLRRLLSYISLASLYLGIFHNLAGQCWSCPCTFNP